MEDCNERRGLIGGCPIARTRSRNSAGACLENPTEGTADVADNADTGGQRATSNAEWGICFAGAAGVCEAELDWSMDLADGAGNGRVRKPRLRTMQDLAESVTGPML